MDYDFEYTKLKTEDESGFYCGKITNVSASEEVKTSIREWIYNEGEFNWLGAVIGKIVKACPSFVKR